MYNEYKIARDRAWKTLIETGANSLPLDLKKISRFYGYQLKVFSSQNEQGFVKENYIYLNKNLSKERARFTLSHELGHILLKHKDLEHANHNEEDNRNVEEYQANIFARGLLMPAIVLKELNCIEPDDIMKMCQVSRTSAVYRSERMKELLRRDKFKLSPLERQVHENFRKFIYDTNFF